MTDVLPQDLMDRFASGSARVERFEHNGRAIWVKRLERLSGRMRLQKGDPRRAFEAERQAYHMLRDRGAPVPELAAEGETFLATFDSGPTLRDLVRDPRKQTILRPALCDAAHALAALHTKGLVHGRPAVKDICWQDGVVTFLDFERTARIPRTLQKMADDLVLFFFSALGEPNFTQPMLVEAKAAYLQAGGGDVWTLARHRLRKLRWVPWLLKPVLPLLGGKREFAALPKTFAFFNA